MLMLNIIKYAINSVCWSACYEVEQNDASNNLQYLFIASAIIMFGI